MDKTNSTFTGYPIFQPSHQELKNSRFRGGLMLAAVVALHSVIAFELLNSPQDEPKITPKIMEVAMVVLPKPEPPKPEIPKPPEPPKPLVKKEIVKPKPIVKPVLVKHITPPKPVLQPKILTTASENAEVSIPKFEAAPTFTPTVPVSTVSKAVSKPAETASESHNESSASSGGTCENCDGIEKRLQRRYARRNFAGSVSFTFTIGEDGKVQNATLKNAEPADMFDDDVISEIKESLMEMEFEPKIVNGKSVSFKGNKTIKFQPSK
ncbi:MAG: energy transducer TonB [Methylococcaceae bacterium]